MVLDRSVDAGDWICGRADYFPLSATGNGITLRGGLRHHSFLTGLDDDGDDYDREITYTLQQHLRPGWTFVDGGAHIGYHTIRASLLVGDAGRVLGSSPTLRTSLRCDGTSRPRQCRDPLRGSRCEAGYRDVPTQPGHDFQLDRAPDAADLIDTFDVPVVTIDDVAERDPRSS